jgi:hypothetical protein
LAGTSTLSSAGFVSWKSRRPASAAIARRFDEVRSYREAVARLCVGNRGAIALDAGCADRQTHPAPATTPIVETLVRISAAVPDHRRRGGLRRRCVRGLPSFLTATASLSQAMDLTAAAARSYGANASDSRGAIFPFRITLALFTATAHSSCAWLRARHRHDANLEEVCRRAGT